MINSGGGQRKKSDETKKMKTVREITGKPGRMCNERRERGTQRESEREKKRRRR